jgi:hypothetical protein
MLTPAASQALSQIKAVLSLEHDPAGLLWNDEMALRERRIFLTAARLPETLCCRAWTDLSADTRAKIKRAMVRFRDRFMPLLSQLAKQEAVQ